MRKHTIFASTVAIILLCAVVLLFTACGAGGQTVQQTQQESKEESPYEFEFTAEGTVINDLNAETTYHVTVYGNKDSDNTVLLKIKEMPVAELEGVWQYIEGKGYKIYLKPIK